MAVLVLGLGYLLSEHASRQGRRRKREEDWGEVNPCARAEVAEECSFLGV
jgi:hypothetical protein